VNARSAEKPEETVVIRKEKEPKRKENRPAGKVENAMKLRFPLSHRACRQKQETTGRENPHQQGGRPVGRHHRPPDLVGPALSQPGHRSRSF